MPKNRFFAENKIAEQGEKFKKEGIFMSNAGFLKGMAAGLLLGACATMLVDPGSDRQRHKLMRKTEGVFKSIGGVIDTAVGMFS